MSDQPRDSLPPWRRTLRQGIHSTVSSINSALAYAEKGIQANVQPLARGVSKLEHSSATALNQLFGWYQHRHEYGSYWIAGGMVTGSLMVAIMRRNVRSPMALTVGALVGGGLAYTVVYEPLDQYIQVLPEIVFGKRK